MARNASIAGPVAKPHAVSAGLLPEGGNLGDESEKDGQKLAPCQPVVTLHHSKDKHHQPVAKRDPCQHGGIVGIERDHLEPDEPGIAQDRRPMPEARKPDCPAATQQRAGDADRAGPGGDRPPVVAKQHGRQRDDDPDPGPEDKRHQVVHRVALAEKADEDQGKEGKERQV
jgi:hypothetical protein